MKCYYVRVQRRYLPCMKTYAVTNHFWSPDESRLTLVLLSGESMQIPQMDRRKMCIESNYRGFMEYKQFQEFSANQQKHIEEHARLLREAAAAPASAPPIITRAAPPPPPEPAPVAEAMEEPARANFWPATQDEMLNFPQ